LSSFKGKTNLGFTNTEFFSHIIFVNTLPCFAPAGVDLDETHIRGCEYEIFRWF